MKKCDEIAQPNSCFNKARGNERLFILLEHDEDAPETIRYWAGRRVLRGKNQPGDFQITEALECARLMEQEQRRLRESR